MVEIHGERSTNCISAVPVLNQLHSGILKSSASVLTTSDTHFASVSRWPNASTTKPPTIGSQISQDKRCVLKLIARSATTAVRPTLRSWRRHSDIGNPTAH